jgi:hypothetical protein
VLLGAVNTSGGQQVFTTLECGSEFYYRDSRFCDIGNSRQIIKASSLSSILRAERKPDNLGALPKYQRA